MDPTLELALDGFPLDPDEPDIRFHRELSNWFEVETSTPTALRFGSPSEWTGWFRAVLRRFAWVRNHGELIASERKLDARLARLIGHFVNRMYPPDIPDESVLADLALHAPAIDTLGAGSMFRADTGRLLLAAAKAGMGAGTRERVIGMLRALPSEDRFGSMHELAWQLFLDENSPGDEACWTAGVMREVRAIRPAGRKPWIALLKLAPIRQTPDAKWAEKIRKAIEKIGLADWEARAGAWHRMAENAPSVSRPAQILSRHMLEIQKVLGTEPATPPDTQELLHLLSRGSYSAFEQLAEYTSRHGYKLEIVEAVRAYHETLHGSVTDQARRQHVGWWLWLEDVTPIKADECWSSIIRADLRGFAGARKAVWLGLLGNMTFAVVTKPPAKWTKIAEAGIAAVGPEDFRIQMRRWLAPLAAGTPLRLSTPGRDVLRCLIWDSALCPADPQLDEALSWIGMAIWKNKESRERMSKIEGPLRDVLSSRNPGLASQVPPVYTPGPQAKASVPNLDAMMSKAMSTALNSMAMGDRIEIHPDHIFVRGERDHYRIGIDGVITRRSGRRVRVNMDALPGYITQLVQPGIDAIDLQQGMFQPNRMRLFSLATILAHDAQWESAIE